MKVQLNQAWDDGHKTFPKYAVIQLADADALALIAEGYAHRVPDDTRLFVSEHLITECVPTGETLTVKELTELPPSAIAESREREGRFFKKK